MKCRNCGANLPANAKFCDACGEPVVRQSFAEKERRNAKKRKETEKKQKIGIIAAAVGILLLLALVWYFFFPKMIHFNPNLNNMSVKVSEEEFEKIEIGMTYDEVCEIVGGKGKLYELFGRGIDGNTYYAWPGDANKKNSFHSHMTVSFNNRTKKADWIDADNIKDVDKIYKGDQLWDYAGETIVDDVENPPIKNGMTYEEVVKALGREGVLIETSYVKDNIYDDKYQQQYYWGLYQYDKDDEFGFNTRSEYHWFENGRLISYD